MKHPLVPKLLGALAAAVLVVGLVPGVSLASARFVDVPDYNPFTADIDWLSQTGVTRGCSTTEYCPKENVTREQMAAFLHRLATGGSVDAGTVQGLGPDDLRGEAGPAGPQGPAGAQGPAGLMGITTKTQSSTFSGIGSSAPQVACDAGQEVLGGGFEASSGMDVTTSKPTANGWQIAFSTAADGSYPYTIYAICATLSS